MTLAFLRVAWLTVLVAATLPDQKADPGSALPEDCAALGDQLREAEQARHERLPILEGQINEINQHLEQGTAAATPPATSQDDLLARRSRLQAEMKALETIRTAYQSAVDACAAAARYRQELGQLADGAAGGQTLNASDGVALGAQLEHVRSARDTLTKTLTQNAERLEALESSIGAASEQGRPALVLERRALQAERTTLDQQMRSYDAQHALLTARLEASGARGDVPRAQDTAAKPAQEETEVRNKQRVAEQLDAEARDRLGRARQQLADLQVRRDALKPEDPQRGTLERDIAYWLRVEQYEQRRIKQAELVQHAAQEKRAIAQLKTLLDEVLKNREHLARDRADLAPEQRQAQAEQHRTSEQQALARSQGLVQKSETKRQEAEPLHKLLASLNAIQDAVRERVLAANSAEESQILEKHYRRMVRQLDAERQQIDLMIMTVENIAFAIAQQADVERQLSAAEAACAEVLVPAVPGFWDRHRRIINSVKIILIALALSYGVRMLIWLIERGLQIVQRLLGSIRISLKRLGTLLAFFGSIIKLFVWIFALIAILDEFGIDPKQSSGAIGLIGLILAGMFQQIVVDFVKGLDIVIGKHYYVGDFVEIDGKYGHVVDFDVKHTRIRTLSGQEFNLPNSRCVPSRRFPDGYVTNYVDFPFSNIADARKAQSIIETVGRDLNQRVEAIRDEPCLQRLFYEVQDGVIGRYRVRVLPGCPWVVNDYFIPEVTAALDRSGLKLSAAPSHTFINRVETFRKLFSRQLSEDEIIREVKPEAVLPLSDEAKNEAALES